MAKRKARKKIAPILAKSKKGKSTLDPGKAKKVTKSAGPKRKRSPKASTDRRKPASGKAKKSRFKAIAKPSRGKSKKKAFPSKRVQKERIAKARKALRAEMRKRSRALALEVLGSLYEKAKKASRRAIVASKTRAMRKLRADFFGGLKHEDLVRHLRNASADWKHFVKMAEEAAGWDMQRIRNEFFSPKARGRPRAK